MEYDDEEVFKSSFVTYLAEGDKLFNSGEYHKALDSYKTALEIEPKNVTALVARSKCYLHIGDAQSALEDAEESLKQSKGFHKQYSKCKTNRDLIIDVFTSRRFIGWRFQCGGVLIVGLYQKAQVLYHMGDFEHALMFYHRGHNLRPELQEFRLGIQKAREAIDNCIGSPQSVKLENKGDLTYFHKTDEGKGKIKPRAQYKPLQKPAAASKSVRTANLKSGPSSRTTKALLGELYADKEYLEKLLKDEDLVKESEGGMSIYDLVASGIHYLDTRTDFWRQQKPMYARKRDRLQMQRKWSMKKNKQTDDQASLILRNLDQIDNYLTEGRAGESLGLAVTTLNTVNTLSEKEIPNKADVIANLHSCIGNAHLELGQTEKALEHHRKDLEISEQYKFHDSRSRALDNLGRVHARVGSFQKAIDCWEQKLHLTKSALESTWLFHEIGRCYLELEKSRKAREYGQKSLLAAKRAKDQMWQLNSGVLIAQAEVKLEMYDTAIRSFQMSLETAKLEGDETAQVAIAKALVDVRKKLIQYNADDEDEDDIPRQDAVPPKLIVEESEEQNKIEE